jgi:hypothetical protein
MKEMRYCGNANVPTNDDKSYKPVICKIDGRRCVADSCLADNLFGVKVKDEDSVHQYNSNIADRCKDYSVKPYSIRTIKKLSKIRMRETGVRFRLRDSRLLGMLFNRG